MRGRVYFWDGLLWWIGDGSSGSVTQKACIMDGSVTTIQKHQFQTSNRSFHVTFARRKSLKFNHALFYCIAQSRIYITALYAIHVNCFPTHYAGIKPSSSRLFMLAV